MAGHTREQGFDTLEVHEQGASFWVDSSQHCARNPVRVKNYSKSLVIKPIRWPQTWQRADGIGQIAA